MRSYETSVRVLFGRLFVLNYPQTGDDDPRLNRDLESLAVSARDGIGLNSATSEHTAHVTLDVYDTPDEVPAPLRRHRPRSWFQCSEDEIAVADTEGLTTLIVPAPPRGRIECVVECTGRDEVLTARHHEHRQDIRDIERWHVTIWPAAPTAEDPRPSQIRRDK